MSTKPKMEIEVTSNTSGYQKGMRAAKKELKDFESVSGKALSDLGSAFGVNTRQVEQLTSAIGGAGRKLSEMGGVGTQALGDLLTGMGQLGTAIGGLGIAGAVVAFKALNAEAQNFKSLAIGDDLQVRADAYRGAYNQYFHDQNQETGKAIAEAETKLGNWWGRFKTQMGSGTVLAIKEASDRWYLGPLQTTAVAVGKAVKGVRTQMEGASQVAEKAADIAGRIDDLQDSISLKTRDWADSEKLIAQYRKDAKDTSLSAAQRMEALNNLEAEINKTYGDRFQIEMEISQLMDEQNSLTESTQDQLNAANAQYVKATGYLEQMNTELTSINKLRSSIATAAGKELDAEMKAANAAASNNAALRQRNAELDRILMKMSAINEADLFKDMRVFEQIERLDSSAITGQATTADTATILVKPVLDKTAVLDLTSELENAITSIASDMGTLVGDLVTGGDAFGNFKNAALSTMGDMAIAVGKIAISTGLATEGIKAALKLGNPYVAIAAGAALVALGAAVKAGLANASTASASYGSSSVASSSYGSSAASSYERVVDVHVTGTLKANGSELVAVLNNEQNRRDYTT